MTQAKLKEIEKLSFEEALDELERIVQKLEGGKGKLDESIIEYERGVELKNHCAKKLSEAELKVQKIVVGKDGNISAVPLDKE